MMISSMMSSTILFTAGELTLPTIVPYRAQARDRVA
jgi:hypothetical protein